MRRLVLCGAVSLTVALGGCVTYSYEGQAYNSAEAALAAAKASNDKVVSQIRPATNRVGGTLNLYSPDKTAILERGIRKTGEPRQEILNYIADVSLISQRGLYDALVKRGSFDRVTHNLSDGQHVPPKAGEFVVYLYQPSVDRVAWFFSSDTVRQQPLHFDMSKAERSERIQYWLDSIDALARVK